MKYKCTHCGKEGDKPEDSIAIHVITRAKFCDLDCYRAFVRSKNESLCSA